MLHHMLRTRIDLGLPSKHEGTQCSERDLDGPHFSGSAALDDHGCNRDDWSRVSWQNRRGAGLAYVRGGPRNVLTHPCHGGLSLGEGGPV